MAKQFLNFQSIILVAIFTTTLSLADEINIESRNDSNRHLLETYSNSINDRNSNSSIIKSDDFNRIASSRSDTVSTKLKHVNSKHKKHAEQPSFMSRVASWLFPFGGESSPESKALDSQAEATGVLPQQYGLPNHPNHHPQYHPPRQQQAEDCNPCNEVPWIPVNNVPAKTVIEFVPPQQNYAGQISNHVQNFGGSNNIFPVDNYGPPPANNYGPPAADNYGPPPPAHTGQHFDSTAHGTLNQQHGVDILALQNNFVPPHADSSNNFAKETFRSPVQQPQIEYGPQQTQQVETHVQSNFGLPPISPVENFPPVINSNNLGPQDTYGPPQPQIQAQVETFPVINNAGPPPNNYGSPQDNYSPPQNNYGPPKDNYVPSHVNFGLIGNPLPPINHNSLGPQLNDAYSLPKPNFGPSFNSNGPIKNKYGPPPSIKHFRPPKSSFGNYKTQPLPPSIVYGSPNIPKLTNGFSQKPGNLYALPSYKPGGTSFNSGPANFHSVQSGHKLSASRKPSHLYAPQFTSDYFGSSAGENTKNTYSFRAPVKLNRPKNQYLPPPIITSGGFSASHFGANGFSNGANGFNNFDKQKLVNIPPAPPQHTTLHFSIPPATNYNAPPPHQVFANHISLQAQYGQPTTSSPAKLVTPTSDEYLPPPHQLPLSTNQEEIPQETSIVHIPVYENTGHLLQPPLAPIAFPQLNPGPIPPIHHAQPFYLPLAQPGHQQQQGNQQIIKGIEIHESENGNLQYLTNIPNLPTLHPNQIRIKINPETGQMQHNHELIKQVIGSIPDKINNGNQAHSIEISSSKSNHLIEDHAISETKHNDNINGILVPPVPQTQHLFHNNDLTTEVKVVQSIPIAEFTSSIEYPARVQQAPIVDIIAQKDIDPNEVVTSLSQHEDGILTRNPIIVSSEDELYSAASDKQNTTIADSDAEFKKESNVKEVRNTKDEGQYESQKFPNHNYNVTLEDQSPTSPVLWSQSQKTGKEYNFVTPSHDNSTHFTPPTIDYSNWAPSSGPLSTSIIPPAPNAGGVWEAPTPTTTLLEQVVPEGMKPPPLHTLDSQKTKQIQIIIPYTSNSRPTPFQPSGSDVQMVGGNWIQEQKAFLSGQAKMPENTDPGVFMTPPSDIPLSWLTNVNRNPESYRNPQQNSDSVDDSVSVPFDILRLQQNIDEWTAQEYSDHLQHSSSNTHDTVVKASTTGQLVPSKKIPNEYLTTTPAINNNDLDPETPVTEVVPSHSNFNPAKSFYDYETAGSSVHSVHHDIRNATVEHLNETVFESNLIIPEFAAISIQSSAAPKTITSPVTTTEHPTTIDEENTTTETILPDTTWETTTETSFYDYYEQQEGNLEKKVSTTTPAWEQAQISISPLTKEKIYVVTPQPWNSDEPTPATAWSSSKSYTPKAASNILDLHDDFGFVSPRFAVRPTPATSKNNIKVIYSEWPQSINNLETTTGSSTTSTTESARNSTSNSSTSKTRTPTSYKALWGLMDLTPYTPPPEGHVETHSGHSKVVTVVTPASIPRRKSGLEEHRTVPDTNRSTTIYAEEVTTPEDYVDNGESFFSSFFN